MITYIPEKRKLALLIPAYNEELVLSATIYAALRSGFDKNDIYVVSDGSTDRTAEIGYEILGSNCYAIQNVGKGNAIKSAMHHFRLSHLYQWISMTDADTLIDTNGFHAITQAVTKHAHALAICGQVKTSKATWISHYRAYEYAIGNDFYKNIESLFNMILITPGCCSTFNARLFKLLEHEESQTNDTFVEDYDLTLEIHKTFKEKVIYESSIVFWTQEPETLKVYVNQALRWYRGWFQVARKRFSFKMKKIDLLIYYFTLDPFIYALELILLISIAFLTKNIGTLSYIVLLDLLFLGCFTVYAAIAKKRYEILSIFPLIFFIRYVNLVLFIKAGIEVIVLNKFPLMTRTWNTPRY